MTPEAPPPPQIRLTLGVTGHREDNAAFTAHRAAIVQVLNDALDAIDAAVRATSPPAGMQAIAPTRLHSLLADGTDQIIAQGALARGWELVAPLPFGRRLNEAINAAPETTAEARALIRGADAADPNVQARALAIRVLADKAALFELADADDVIAAHYLAKLEDPTDAASANRFNVEASRRVALAARVLIEQSDFLIAVWDGETTAFVGGTGHTIAAALSQGTPVLWIDPADPAHWRVLRTPESLSLRAPVDAEDRDAALASLVRTTLFPFPPTRKAHGPHEDGVHTLTTERWRTQSNPLWQAYRRVEALFARDDKGRSPLRSLRVTYETPDAIAAGSGAGLLDATRALPGGDPDLADKVERLVLRRFAWADGVSSDLSDTYRGGMVANFVLSSFAIVVGIAYLPFATMKEKVYFALAEFVLLGAILVITNLGQSRRWHGRWFETRRVAEYLRHSPLMLALGAARPPGRWPRGADTSWPEWYVLHALRDIGLPRATITRPYLHAALTKLLNEHVVTQRNYHHAKARRLTAVHNNLDKLSEALFVLAVLSVALFLAMTAIAHIWPAAEKPLYTASKVFTFLGVMLPTFGAAIAGVRYFGDFERFAAISEATAGKLDATQARIALLLAAGEDGLDYGLAADLAHAADDIVVSEIENWQAVFGGKHVTVPV